MIRLFFLSFLLFVGATSLSAAETKMDFPVRVDYLEKSSASLDVDLDPIELNVRLLRTTLKNFSSQRFKEAAEATHELGRTFFSCKLSLRYSQASSPDAFSRYFKSAIQGNAP
ncbi:hypothetical protein [Algoriphagus sp. CAU 1675]|uniref:hypothetical protein n=1 Tax=Algoriphagus sp. CAU 1675 TaxID=3032597 RepID=UPI0023DCAEE2|nr:hypothetical protein [Algoriphagus sp. CAU 1675]MDF2157783.1 hypothetical protein [Algoriphagus sp. CAU 1675]